MAWSIELSGSAVKTLKNLDRQTAGRIRDYLRELETLEDVRSRGKGTTANLSGLWRYRIGDYRAVCELQDGRLIVLVLSIGHRSRVYD